MRGDLELAVVEEPIGIGRTDHAIDVRALDRDSLGAQRHISHDRLGDHARLEMNAAGLDAPLADVEILGDDLYAYVVVAGLRGICDSAGPCVAGGGMSSRPSSLL